MSRELVTLTMGVMVTPEVRATGCTGNIKAVLVALAFAVPEGGRLAEVTLGEINEKVGLSERTIQRHLRWLEAHDWISIIPRPNASSLYLIHTSTLAPLSEEVAQ